MAFKNVNKVILEDKDDVIDAYASVLLLEASIIYDHVQAKEYDKIDDQLGILACAVKNIHSMLKEHQKKAHETAEGDAE